MGINTCLDVPQLWRHGHLQQHARAALIPKEHPHDLDAAGIRTGSK